ERYLLPEFGALELHYLLLSSSRLSPLWDPYRVLVLLGCRECHHGCSRCSDSDTHADAAYWDCDADTNSDAHTDVRNRRRDGAIGTERSDSIVDELQSDERELERVDGQQRWLWSEGLQPLSQWQLRQASGHDVDLRHRAYGL